MQEVILQAAIDISEQKEKNESIQTGEISPKVEAMLSAKPRPLEIILIAGITMIHKSLITIEHT